jgi:peptidoglycan/LPS O-acetylase OafA/YrhL
MHIKNTYIPSLNGFRAVSILIVILSHAGFSYIVPGGLGVTIFFFLSGYLITTLLIQEQNQYNKINIIKFYLRRFFRLAPALFLTICIAYSLVFLHFLPGKATFLGFLAQLFYFYNYYALFFDGYSNVPRGTSILWSLAVEEHFYILYPILFSVLAVKLDYKKIGLFFIFLCLIILFWRYYLTLAPNFDPDRTYYATDARLDSILFGCILAVLKNPMKDEVKDSAMRSFDWLLLIASIGLILSSVLVRGVQFRESLRYSIQGIALIPIFYFGIIKSKSLLYKTLNLKPLQKLGELSYSVYLIHFILINAILFYTSEVEIILSPLVIFFITILMSIIYAIFIDRFVEPYFRVLRKKFH